MVQISVEMVRKKAEHHDCLLSPLEEIALHQENIEKLEFIQDWCPKLKILLMQNNLIAKIENLNKLKSLQYLNLALNNIEIIENLDRCESLQKLDLTLNFIGVIVSIESLVGNYNLENLYLTGNPCTDYENYRDFVIGTLPQLVSLDGRDIDRSDRIKALQNLPIIRSYILYEQKNYIYTRKMQKIRIEKEIQNKWSNEYKDMDLDDITKQFWSEKTEHAPEVRYEIERMRLLKSKSYNTENEKEEKRELKFFTSDGRPFNINQPKILFKFTDTLPNAYTLDLAIYKHLDTSLLDIDIQPNYVRVTIKNKIFQLHLPEDVEIANSTAQRSQTTGHLIITMPKATIIADHADNLHHTTSKKPTSFEIDKNAVALHVSMVQTKREFLEIGPSDNVLDFTQLTKTKSTCYRCHDMTTTKEKECSPDFVDNPEVPDLI